MGVLQHVAAPEGMSAGNGYSQVVTGRDRLVVVSGQIAQDERGDLVGPGDPGVQARQVFENMRRCLAQAGTSFDDVMKLTFFCSGCRGSARGTGGPGRRHRYRPAACEHGYPGRRTVRPWLPARGGSLGPGR